jgi:hypothetical protein
MPLENGECDWGTEALEKLISNTAANTDNGYKIRDKFDVNERVENVSKADLEDPAVQHMVKMLRQC